MIDTHQLLAELLPALEFCDFTLGFVQRRGSGETLVDRLALHLATQAELGMVPGIVGPGTVTGGFSAAAPAGGDGTGPQIAQTEELLKQLSAFRLCIMTRPALTCASAKSRMSRLRFPVTSFKGWDWPESVASYGFRPGLLAVSRAESQCARRYSWP